ncbi:MAG: hypothetical protein ACRCS0_12795, partial [Albidovulum sp.]
RLHVAEAPAKGHENMVAAATNAAPCHDAGDPSQPAERNLAQIACMFACACLPAQPAPPAAISTAMTGERLPLASDREPASAPPDRQYRPPASA